MTIRTDQLLHIAEVTNSKIYTWELEAEADGQTKALELSLKQYHVHYYWLYEKEMPRAMIGLQRLHSDHAFRCPNISSSVGLKLFCPWCFKLGTTMRWYPSIWGRCITGLWSCGTSVSHLPACPHRAFSTTTQGTRSRALKNVQNKEDLRRQKSSIRKSPRCKKRKKHPNARLGNT